MKIWRPDTCECEVEEIYEGDTIKGGGVVLNKCTAHASVPDAALYGVLYSNADGENKRKNLIERALLGFEGTNFGLHETVVNSDGSTTVRFKNGISFTWSFSGTGAGRVLNVSVVGATLTTPQKNAVTTFAQTKFGAGKVIIT